MLVTFVILTGGHRTETVTRLCSSISRQSLDCETIVVGEISRLKESTRTKLLAAADLAKEGKISHMRNVAARQAQGNILAFLDDDLELDDSWFRNMESFFSRIIDREIDGGSSRLVGPNGKRWYDWNWASRINPKCPTLLLPYGTHSKNTYFSGCCMIMRRDVWEDVPYDENLGYYLQEDIQFCHRAIDAGYSFSCQFSAEALHLLLPSGRPQGEGDMGQYYFNQSIYQYRCGNPLKAITLLEKARSLGLADEIWHYYKGWYSFLQGRNELSINNFKLCLESLASSENQGLVAQTNYRLGLALLKNKNEKGALECFQNTLKIFPDHPMALGRKARIETGKLQLPY